MLFIFRCIGAAQGGADHRFPEGQNLHGLMGAKLQYEDI